MRAALVVLFSSAIGLISTAPTPTPPTSTNGQCGQSNGARCGPGNCCSQYGWCGSTQGHCFTGCQPGWGECWSSYSTPTSTSSASAAATSVQPPVTTQPSTSTSTASLTTSSIPVTSPKGTIRVIRNCVTPNAVAITFDDGPYTYTSQIAQRFTQAGGNVTFFMNGLNWACIYDHAEAVKAAYDAGHQIGSHTWSHPDLTTLSVTEVSSQMNALSIAFKRILGAVPVYMRPPYGSYNDRTIATLQSLGFKVIALWDVDSGDSLGASLAQQQLTYNSTSVNGSHIALQHETSLNTVQNMVPFIIGWAQQRKLKMVTVGECLGDAPASWYKDYVTAENRNSSWTCNI